MKRILLSLLFLGPLAVPGRVGAQSTPQRTVSLIWHQGPLADLLVRMAEDYTRQTGTKIRPILFPLGDDWYRTIADTFASRRTDLDLVVFDSQSMSEFASQGHLVRLNDRLDRSGVIRPGDFDPAALSRYSEYPEHSGNIYALPINQDCMGLVLRRDLFESPDEQAAFRRKYGNELKIPGTYDDLRLAAEFFHRPERGLYGIALYGSEDYDACTSAFNNILWSFGAELWDSRAATASGHINSAAARRALEFYRDLFCFAPLRCADWYADDVHKALTDGRVALAVHWFYYLPDLATADTASGRFLFAALPGQKDESGRLRRYVMVGGQGVAISRYSQNQDEAWKFLEWFFARERQWKWVEGGGKTGLAFDPERPAFCGGLPGERSVRILHGHDEGLLAPRRVPAAATGLSAARPPGPSRRGANGRGLEPLCPRA